MLRRAIADGDWVAWEHAVRMQARLECAEGALPDVLDGARCARARDLARQLAVALAAAPDRLVDALGAMGLLVAREAAVAAAEHLAWATAAEHALVRSAARLRALAARVEAAREEERGRVARELHDGLGQQIAAVHMDLAWLARRQGGAAPEVAERIRALSALLEATLHTVRRVASELRPGVLDDIGLPDALAWQARDFQSHSGILVQVDDVPALALDPRHATALFRIFQEVLGNVARHAGARQVRARLWEHDELVTLEVADDGRGIHPDEITGAESVGLLAMAERARHLGGTFDVGPGSAGGTVVSVTVPRGQLARLV